MSNILLEVKDICKSYKKLKTSFYLNNINFNISKGEIISVLGLNGAGKTTLMRILLSLLSPDKGTIKFNDELSINSFCRVGYLPESFSLRNSTFSVFNFVKLIAQLNRINTKEIDAIVRNSLDLFGLTAYQNNSVKVLSKGTLTRLGLTQALIGQPLLTILDEPTEGLDPNWRSKTKSILLSLKEKGISFLISSHLLYEIEQISDKILIIHKGAQIYFGKPDFVSINSFLKNSFKNEKFECPVFSKHSSLEEIFLTIIEYYDKNKLDSI